jgi:hypothetical protein
MKLPLLLALLACAAPASAGDLPTWTAQPGGLWRNIVFTDPNGAVHSLWCNPAQCGPGRSGAANLYETAQVSQVPMQLNNGAILPWNRESWQAWRTTWSTKLSHWRYDNVTREAFQGDHRVATREQSQMYATGSLWIVQPPSARRTDAFTEVARREPPRRDPPPRQEPPRRDPPPRQDPPRNPARILEFTLFGETGQLVDGRPYPEKESDWLSYAEHREFLAACPQQQGVAPTDNAACRAAVTTARGRIAENMRTEVWLQGKTYQQRYREIVTNLPPDGAARDNRVTDLLSLLAALRDKKYGQPPDTEHEVQLRAEERSRLGAAQAGAVTAGKTGAVLLQEYDAARAALDARDHVGLWQATTRIRREVPPAGPGRDAPNAGLLPRLTPAQRDRLSAEERTAYDAVIPPQPPDAPVNSPAQQAAIRRALDWLRDHPTAQEFAAITDEAERRRICDKMRMERDASAGRTGAAAGPDAVNPNAGARAQLEGREGEATTAARSGDGSDQSRVLDGQTPGAATAARPGYTWPPEIIAACEQLASREPGRTTPPPSQVPPPPAAQPGGSANMTAAPVGRPINDPAKETPPLTSWNPLLNAAKGGLAGAIVGFALGGPLGMLVGALVFGGAAWGLTKVDNA